MLLHADSEDSDQIILIVLLYILTIVKTEI